MIDERGWIYITTLRDYIEHGHTITAHCIRYMPEPACTHWSKLNLDHLVQRLGWDFQPVRDREILIQRLVCSKCGSRGATFTCSTDQADRASGMLASCSTFDPLLHPRDADSAAAALQRELAMRKEWDERDRANGTVYVNKGTRRRRFGRARRRSW